ncbi:hypothetical protein GC101_25915 [Paenibacillus sp. LMG 31459]|uniref:Uncharacterized protein n=1 Tax=Paenibacillus phytohabitans TaxID=2654978 RepID=A0ABX1YN61_9BACL|nr:hypothetical protein [Paenibacillus phytohabitans]NOU82308.1 hypothetical protein [Paenibacillus phytohabitans]
MKNFIDYSHKNQYRLIKAQLPEEKRNDINLLPIVYLMAGDEIFRNKVTQFINWSDGNIDWDKLFSSYGDNEKLTIMIKLSAELYSHKQMVSITELIYKFEKKEFELVLMLFKNLNEGLHFGTYETDSLDSYI